MKPYAIKLRFMPGKRTDNLESFSQSKFISIKAA